MLLASFEGNHEAGVCASAVEVPADLEGVVSQFHHISRDDFLASRALANWTTNEVACFEIVNDSVKMMSSHRFFLQFFIDHNLLDDIWSVLSQNGGGGNFGIIFRTLGRVDATMSLPYFLIDWCNQ